MNNLKLAFDEIFKRYSTDFEEDGEVSLVDLDVSREGKFLRHIPDNYFHIGKSIEITSGEENKNSRKKAANFLKSTVKLIDEHDEQQSHLPPDQRSSLYEKVPIVSHNLADAMTHLEKAATESFAGLKVASQAVQLPLPRLPPLPLPPAAPPQRRSPVAGIVRTHAQAAKPRRLSDGGVPPRRLRGHILRRTSARLRAAPDRHRPPTRLSLMEKEAEAGAAAEEEEHVDSVTDILGTQPAVSQVGLPRLPGRILALKNY